jgi:hypothetical protein
MSTPARKPPTAAPTPAPTPGEALWRNGFFLFSALTGALALVDLDAGRVAHAMGDAGVACLLLSLMPQFPFVRTMMRQDATPQARERLLAEAEQLRAQYPWSERLSRVGWMLLLGSLALRLLGAA